MKTIRVPSARYIPDGYYIANDRLVRVQAGQVYWCEPWPRRLAEGSGMTLTPCKEAAPGEFTMDRDQPDFFIVQS